LPPALDSIAPAGFTIDDATHTISFTRRFAADRDAVFTAWTDPQHVAGWWDPTGEPLERCEIDLRVGGSFTFVTRAHPGMPFSGVYRQIAPPGRLVFDAMGAEGRVTLAEAQGGTLMRVEIACVSAEHLEQFVKMGVAAGTSQTLDNLVAHLGGAPR
jgi:uncharacterized protein YndB with AHSA1/START domain